MTGFHVTTTKKLARYQATHGILPPVRFWAYLESAKKWARKTGRDVILRIEVETAHPLPDHWPNGHGYWSPEIVRTWKILDGPTPTARSS